MKVRSTALATCAVIFAADFVSAQDSYANLHYCEIEADCRLGNRVEDQGYQTGPWKPFETENLFVWAADVCLGYFMTRKPEALNGGVATSKGDSAGNTHIYVELGDHTKNLEGSARVHIFNFPFTEYGVFGCDNMTIPPLSFDPDEFQRWADDRLKVEEGWKPSSFFAIDTAEFRNEKIGAIIRVLVLSGQSRFSLQADYFGPPIISE